MWHGPASLWLASQLGHIHMAVDAFTWSPDAPAGTGASSPVSSPAGMDCLVTGGAGFIGSNLVDALLARGDRVTVIDNLSTGKRSNLEQAVDGGAVLYETDIRDAAAVSEVFASAQPEVVFHLAAQIDVRHSVTDPADGRPW